MRAYVLPKLASDGDTIELGSMGPALEAASKLINEADSFVLITLSAKGPTVIGAGVTQHDLLAALAALLAAIKSAG